MNAVAIDVKEQIGELIDFEGGVQALRDQLVMAMLQGRIVPHDPAEEDAGVLLHRIRETKEAKVEAREIPAPAAVPSVVPEEMPFTLPANWAWSRWGDVIFDIETGGSSETSNEHSDFVLVRRGPEDVVGRSTIAAEVPRHFGSELMHLRMSEEMDSRFFNLANNSPAGRAYYASLTAREGDVESIESSAVTHMPFPIPPRAEQERIVARMEELMTFCDELEAELRQRNGERQEELGRAVGELLNWNS